MEFVEGAIVVAGHMNPAIFSPAWLRRLRIADEEEIAAAETDFKEDLIIAGGVDLAQIHCRNFRLQCRSERFTCTVTQSEHFELLRQVVSRVFRQLGHTPVRAMGINFRTRTTFETKEKASAVLHGLFVSDLAKLDSTIGEGWNLSTRLTTNDTWPRLQITTHHEEEVLTLFANHHYAGDELSSGVQVADLVQDRFESDKRSLQRIVTELFGK